MWRGPAAEPGDPAAGVGAALRSPSARGDGSFHDLLIDNAAEYVDVIQLESGKARRHAFEEVLDVAIQARYYAHTAAAFLGEPRRRQGALPVLTKAWEYRTTRAA